MQYGMPQCRSRCRISSKCRQQCLFRPITVTMMFSGITSPAVQLAVSLAGFLLLYGIYKIFSFIYNDLTSPLRQIPGPPSPSFIYGSFKQLSESVSRKPQCTLSHTSGCLNGQSQIE